MPYTLDQMATALARREVIKKIAEFNILIFDLNELETATTALLAHKNFYPEALFYINEWARLDAEETQSNVIPLR